MIIFRPVKRHRPSSPRQSFLLPPSPQDWPEDGRLAHLLLGVVDR